GLRWFVPPRPADSWVQTSQRPRQSSEGFASTDPPDICMSNSICSKRVAGAGPIRYAKTAIVKLSPMLCPSGGQRRHLAVGIPVIADEPMKAREAVSCHDRGHVLPDHVVAAELGTDQLQPAQTLVTPRPHPQQPQATCSEP